MDGFEATLREQVDTTRERLEQAVQSDTSYEIHLHGARMMDLLDRAGAHGIDTTGWVDTSVLTLARDSV